MWLRDLFIVDKYVHDPYTACTGSFPSNFRRFPDRFKQHLSHDILLLCVKCHQLSNVHDLALKRQLSAECGAPLSKASQKFSEDPYLLKVRNHARYVTLISADAFVFYIPPQKNA